MAVETNMITYEEIRNDVMNMALFKEEEISQSIKELKMRLLWNVDSLCFLYSRSKDIWCKAQIVDIFFDDNTNEEWLRVKYDGKCFKNMQRLNHDIKPLDLEHDSNPKINAIIAKKFKSKTKTVDANIIHDHEIKEEDINFKIFDIAWHQSNCDEEDGCDHLRRLATALQYYQTLNPTNNKSSEDTFTTFCIDIYPQLLDDIAHLQSNHANETKEISAEFIKSYHLIQCNIQKCLQTQRHYNRENKESNVINNETDSQFEFYRGVMDRLHFNIFHVYDAGLRIEHSDIRYNDDDNNDYTDCIDDAFGKIRDAIHGNSIKYDRIYTETGDVEESSKFNIQIGYHRNRRPWIEIMFEFISNNKLDIDTHHLGTFFMDEEYDSDAIVDDMYDFDEDKATITNISILIHNHQCAIRIKEYAKYTKLSSVSFSTGLTFWYWSYYDPSNNTEIELDDHWNVNDYGGFESNELFITKGRYKTLKQEIINSGHCTMKQFNDKIMLKATKFMDTFAVKSYAEQYKKLANSLPEISNPQVYVPHHIEIERILHYDLQTSQLSSQNIQSIICYCDFTKLCTEFSSTFRAIYFGETLSSIKKRNERYYHLSRILRETVEYFGCCAEGDRDPASGFPSDRINKSFGPYYCGVSRELVISTFNIRLCGPTSTSKQIAVALNFAKEEGSIIQLNNDGDFYAQKLRCFNCSWISNYAEEDERLFFGGSYRIRLQSVRIIATKQDLSVFFHALYHFDAMVDGSNMKNCRLKVNQMDHEILKILIQYEIDGSMNRKIPEYIYNTFHLYCRNKNTLCFNLEFMQTYFNKLSHLIMEQNACKAIVFELFPNIKQLILYVDHTFKWRSFNEMMCSLSYKPQRIVIKRMKPLIGLVDQYSDLLDATKQPKMNGYKSSYRITRDARNLAQVSIAFSTKNEPTEMQYDVNRTNKKRKLHFYERVIVHTVPHWDPHRGPKNTENKKHLSDYKQTEWPSVMDAELLNKKIDEMIRETDIDGDGIIDYDEFVKAMMLAD